MTNKKLKIADMPEGLINDENREALDTVPDEEEADEVLNMETEIGKQLPGKQQPRKIKVLGRVQNVVGFGSNKHKEMLAAGYQMSVEEAEQIIKERNKDPRLYPYDVYTKAKAVIEQSKVKPVVVSKTKHWKRPKQRF